MPSILTTRKDRFDNKIIDDDAEAGQCEKDGYDIGCDLSSPAYVIWVCFISGREIVAEVLAG